MSDGGYDPCECLWNHESAMQRLMGLLRSSQSYCNDNECFGDLPGPQGERPGNNPIFLMMLAWVVIAVLLYFHRPGSLRNQGDTKSSNGNNQGRRDPPPPAVN